MPVRTTIVATNDLIDANLLNAVYGAWNAYTPTVSQGATTNIAKTVTYAKYRQAGKTVDGQVSLVVTGSGTAGFAVQVTLPVAAANTSANLVVGPAFIYDASGGAGAQYYHAVAFLGASSKAYFGRTDTIPTTNWGGDPYIALAVGDSVSFQFTYEAA